MQERNTNAVLNTSIMTQKTFAAFIICLMCSTQILYAQTSQTQKNHSSNQQSNMGKIHSKTIVFVTGAFVSSSCWDEWKIYFESQGYKAIVPSGKFKEGSASELRAMHPDKNPKLSALTLSELLDYYTEIINKCPEKPIIIGHSLGGLITQILINRGLGVAGIAIHPAPPQGVFPYEWSSLKSIIGAFGYFTSAKKTYLMSFKTWQYAFTNGMSLQEQEETYEQLIIPESKTVSRTAITKQGKVDFKKRHAPLLFIAGGKDHILPAHLTHRIFKRYNQKNGSVTEYKEFKDRNHFVLGLPKWKETADYILNWVAAQ
jgi:pimeloyl-ACP methyl ester carboxylesterase